jgi:hypothetical protein
MFTLRPHHEFYQFPSLFSASEAGLLCCIDAPVNVPVTPHLNLPP